MVIPVSTNEEISIRWLLLSLELVMDMPGVYTQSPGGSVYRGVLNSTHHVRDFHRSGSCLLVDPRMKPVIDHGFSICPNEIISMVVFTIAIHVDNLIILLRVWIMHPSLIDHSMQLNTMSSEIPIAK